MSNDKPLPKISYRYNEDTQSFELMLVVGGFVSEAKARIACDQLATILNRHFDAGMLKVN